MEEDENNRMVSRSLSLLKNAVEIECITLCQSSEMSLQLTRLLIIHFDANDYKKCRCESDLSNQKNF